MTHYLLRAVLLITLVASGSTHAVTLGQVHVNSFLGEPLDAEIDLIGLAPGQHEDLRLRIANNRHFERFGITHTQFLASLTFDVAQSDNRWIVRARSSQPVREPFLDFPLQMTWPGGQLIKQYTLLVDPRRRIRPARSTRSTRPAPASAPVRPQTESDMSSYGPVQPGETLWPIAKKLKPSGITTRQMAMALLRANPAAFIDGNINKLRAGATLAIPQQAFIEQLDAKTARAEFAAQTRRRQAPVATSPRVIETPAPTAPKQMATVDVQEATAPETTEPDAQEQENNPQLRIVTDPDRSDAEPGSQQDLQEQLLVTMEEIESNRITTGAIESRLARMEAELERMQKLVELKDAQIAALESDVATHEAIQAAAQKAEPPPPAPATAPRPALQRPSPTATAATPAPVTITRLEPVTTAKAQPPARPWYEEYIWVLWILLGLVGLLALLMLIRRPQPGPEDARMAQLPEVPSASGGDPQTRDTPPAADLEEAEEDFRRLAEQQLRETTPGVESEQALPEMDLSPAAETDDDIHSGITDSLLDEMLDDNRPLTDHPAPTVDNSEFSDDDIASWVAELGSEAEQIDVHSANDDSISADDDIPGILTQLDDQLSTDKSLDAYSPVAAPEEPSDKTHEDDTFSMSLDLARAYLEIGDQEGARDMLKQALAGTRDPDHRRQIEELLAQVN